MSIADFLPHKRSRAAVYFILFPKWEVDSSLLLDAGHDIPNFLLFFKLHSRCSQMREFCYVIRRIC